MGLDKSFKTLIIPLFLTYYIKAFTSNFFVVGLYCNSYILGYAGQLKPLHKQ